MNCSSTNDLQATKRRNNEHSVSTESTSSYLTAAWTATSDLVNGLKPNRLHWKPRPMKLRSGSWSGRGGPRLRYTTSPTGPATRRAGSLCWRTRQGPELPGRPRSCRSLCLRDHLHHPGVSSSGIPLQQDTATLFLIPYCKSGMKRQKFSLVQLFE